MNLRDQVLLSLSYRYVPALTQRLLLSMENSPKTIRELCAEVDGHYQSVYKVIRYLHTQRLIGIKSWATLGHGPYFPRFGLGYSEPPQRPPKLTQAERSQRHRAKKQILSGLSMADLLIKGAPPCP